MIHDNHVQVFAPLKARGNLVRVLHDVPLGGTTPGGNDGHAKFELGAADGQGFNHLPRSDVVGAVPTKQGVNRAVALVLKENFIIPNAEGD